VPSEEGQQQPTPGLLRGSSYPRSLERVPATFTCCACFPITIQLLRCAIQFRKQQKTGACSLPASDPPMPPLVAHTFVCSVCCLPGCVRVCTLADTALLCDGG